MNDVDRYVSELNPLLTEDLGDEARTPEALALLRRVLDDPIAVTTRSPSPPRRISHPRRWVAAVASVAVAATVMALWPTGAHRPPSESRGRGSTHPQLRLVDFSMQGDEIIARITDPDAASDQLTAVFQAHGLDISVQTLPVSPSLVGTIVYDDAPSIRSLQAGDCLGGGTSCTVGLVIPADFTGEANVAVGRVANAGESFASSAVVFGPGEVLHCSGVLGEPVTDALPVLQAMGLDVRWQSDNPNPPVQGTPGGSGQSLTDQGSPAGYVIGGTALSSSSVLLETSPQQPDTPEFRDFEAEANQGC